MIEIVSICRIAKIFFGGDMLIFNGIGANGATPICLLILFFGVLLGTSKKKLGALGGILFLMLLWLDLY